MRGHFNETLRAREVDVEWKRRGLIDRWIRYCACWKFARLFITVSCKSILHWNQYEVSINKKVDSTILGVLYYRVPYDMYGMVRYCWTPRSLCIPCIHAWSRCILFSTPPGPNIIQHRTQHQERPRGIKSSACMHLVNATHCVSHCMF